MTAFPKEARSSANDLARLFEQTPPAAVEQEMCLIGSMILDGRVIGEVIQILNDENDFYRTQHAAIYRVLIDLFDRNEPIDFNLIVQRLRDASQLEAVGGLDYLVDLVESVTSAASAPYYARSVRDAALKRRLIDVAASVLHTAYRSSESIEEQLNRAESELFGLAKTRKTRDVAHLKQLLQETYERLEASEGKFLAGLDTGFRDLNEMTTGFQGGELIIVAARPSMGKTAFALNIAEHIASKVKKGVLVFSLEMSAQQLAQRMLCARSGVDAQKVRKNMLSADDFAALALAVGDLSEAPLYIDDTPGLDMLTLNAKARRMAQEHDIAAIFVDYLQLMSYPGAPSREQEVSSISRGIKGLARELNVPIVTLSQLNRGPESREGHRPRMSDLRESGSIEQDADMVLMLHREEYYHSDNEWRENNPDKVGVAECIITKQRNGPIGSVELQFDGKTVRFRDLAHPAANF